MFSMFRFPRARRNPVVYGTSDGQVFSTKQAADAHQLKVNVDEFLRELVEVVHRNSGMMDPGYGMLEKLSHVDSFRRGLAVVIARRMS